MPIGALMAARSKPAKLAKAMRDHLCELGVKNTTKQFVITYNHHTPSGLKNRRLRNMIGHLAEKIEKFAALVGIPCRRVC